MAGEFWQTFFVKPMSITGVGRLAMLAPLALSISIVYKTIHCRRLSSVPGESLKLCFMIVAGMLLFGGALLGVFYLLA